MRSKQRLSAEVVIGSTLSGDVRRNLDFVGSALRGLGREIKGVEQKQRELGRAREVLVRQGKAVDALDREYRQLTRTLERLRRRQIAWERTAASLRRVGGAARAAATEFVALGRRVVIGATVAGGALFGLAATTAALGDDVAKTAGKLGIGIEALQEMRYAAERSGVSTERFDTSVQRMVRTLSAAAAGSGAAADSLAELGIDAAALNTAGPEASITAIADALAAVENPSDQARLAMALFGREGASMMNMLRGGSEGLRQLREDARRTGYVLSEKAARDAEVFQDRMLDARLTMLGLRNTLGAALMPVITDAMESFSTWARTSQETIGRFATALADGLGTAIPIIGELALGLTDVAVVAGGLIGSTAELVGGYRNLGIAIGGLFAGRLIWRLGRLAWAIGGLMRAGWGLAAAYGVAGLAAGRLGRAARGAGAALRVAARAAVALGRALLLTPLGLKIAAIAGAAYLVKRHWRSIGPFFRDLWGDVEAYVVAARDTIGAALSGDMAGAAAAYVATWEAAGAVLRRVLDGIGATFTAVWTDIIKPITDELGITAPIVSAWEAASSAIGGALAQVGAFFSQFWSRHAKPVIDALLSFDPGPAWRAAAAAIGSALDAIKARFDAALGWIKPVVDALERVLDRSREAGGAVDEANRQSTAFRAAQSASAPTPGGPGARSLDPRSDVARDYPFHPSSPILERAAGGPIGRGPVLVGERGPEVIYASRAAFVANNEQLSRMRSAARESARPPAPAASTPARNAAPAQVSQTFHVHAHGASAQEVVAILERRARQARNAALYDHAGGYGQYEGAR